MELNRPTQITITKRGGNYLARNTRDVTGTGELVGDASTYAVAGALNVNGARLALNDRDCIEVAEVVEIRRVNAHANGVLMIETAD